MRFSFLAYPVQGSRDYLPVYAQIQLPIRLRVLIDFFLVVAYPDSFAPTLFLTSRYTSLPQLKTCELHH